MEETGQQAIKIIDDDNNLSTNASQFSQRTIAEPMTHIVTNINTQIHGHKL